MFFSFLVVQQLSGILAFSCTSSIFVAVILFLIMCSFDGNKILNWIELNCMCHPRDYPFQDFFPLWRPTISSPFSDPETTLIYFFKNFAFLKPNFLRYWLYFSSWDRNCSKNPFPRPYTENINLSKKRVLFDQLKLVMHMNFLIIQEIAHRKPEDNRQTQIETARRELNFS